MTTKGTYLLKIINNLEEWRAEIDRLRSSFDPSRVRDKIEYYQSLIDHYQQILDTLENDSSAAEVEA